MKSSRIKKVIAVIASAMVLASTSTIVAFAASQNYKGMTAEYYVNHSNCTIDITINPNRNAHTAVTDLRNYSSDINKWQTVYYNARTGYTRHKNWKTGCNGTAVCAGLGKDCNRNNFVFRYKN